MNRVNSILSWIKEHLVIVLVAAIIIVIALFFILQPREEIKFELYGSSDITIYKGEMYYEYGYYLSNTTDYRVTILSPVDTNTIGSYFIKYRLTTTDGTFKLEKVRKVNVIEDPLKSVTLTLNGDPIEYILINNVYKDPGAKAIYNGNDISSSIKVKNNVNPNVEGNYEVKYTIQAENREKTITRYVRVFDFIFESAVNYSKKLIDINIVGYDFDYVLLPDRENKKTEEEFTYNYKKSGSQIFTIYTKHGFYKSYEVTVLDKVKPTATCKASINGSTTEVDITATDEGGINRYMYGKTTYKTNKFTINEKLSTFLIRVYDNGENYVDVECKTRRTFDNNMDDIVLAKELTPCHNDWSSYNTELANLVQEYGPKTRDAVAGSADYLAKFPYKIAYSWGGKSSKPGINPEWGCSKHTRRTDSGKLLCTKETGNDNCIYGNDCTGYTAWAYTNAGFDPSIIRTSNQSEGKWGNFNAAKHKYSFSGNQDKVNQIKPGDIVWTEGHVGIVIGTDDTRLKVANQTGGIIITFISKKNGRSLNGQRSFTHFVLMDDFFEMYGNKY